jgi:uncharacterized protein YnzC (UPF0291/DUF896 family)
MRYSENYTQVCDETEAQAARILGRPLTEREKQGIWGSGTLTWLEMRVQVPLRRAYIPEQVETVLDDAADDFQERLTEMIAGLSGMLGTLLERELSEDERQQLTHIPTVLAAMQMGEDLTAAEAQDRESLLQERLTGLV